MILDILDFLPGRRNAICFPTQAIYTIYGYIKAMCRDKVANDVKIEVNSS